MQFTIIPAVPTDAPRACGPILRSIPEWFGIEEATAGYIAATATKPTWIAWVGDAAAGFVSITRHYPGAAEIHCIAVHKDFHGRGVGTALVRHVEALLRDDGVRYLQVKTMGPSRPNAEYARTLRFYESRGFERLEEVHGLWPRMPALILVKRLSP
jgi:ribosomal protein S18 acetylase RimI-like enzyme